MQPTDTPPEDTDRSLATLAAALGHVFKNESLLAEAVTHPSLMGATRRPVGAAMPRWGYERLEFLGDRVLGLVIADILLARFPDEPEGGLAKRHTALVRAEALVRVAEALGLGIYLRLAPGEVEAGGRAKPAILADACEAVIGALFQDGGFDVAARFVRQHWASLVDGAVELPIEPKTALQEWALARGLPLPHYELVGRHGPDHEPVFEVRVGLRGQGEEMGTGSSKRAAEKAAAQKLLQRLV